MDTTSPHEDLWVAAFARRMAELGPYRRGPSEFVARAVYPLCCGEPPSQAAEEHLQAWRDRDARTH